MASSSAQQAQYRRIADGIRGQIIDGTWTTGMQLPATDKLAGTWNTSYGTIHSALQKLVKEGWIERLDGSGTFVAEHQNRFTCAGIYHSKDIFADEQNGFARALHTLLAKHLTARGKKSAVFVDSRPVEDQHELLPELEEAIRLRRIQCLLAPVVTPTAMTAFTRLRVPAAFVENPISPNQVHISHETMVRGFVRSLARQGCRSIGLITHVPRTEDTSVELRLQDRFERIMREEGLTTDAKWISNPPRFLADFERFGYRDFKAFWALPEKPDGLVVYPDVVARGVISAVLELRVQEVPNRLKFAFHRNAMPLPLCPFSATWAVLDVEKVAEAMLNLIDRQFAGEPNAEICLDHTFEESGPLV